MFIVAMHQIEYRQSRGNHTLFFKKSDREKLTTFIVHIDDKKVTRNDDLKITWLKKKLAGEFEIKDLGKLRYFFQIKVAYSIEDVFFISMEIHSRFLKETRTVGSNAAGTSIEQNCCLGETSMNTKYY